MPTSDSKKAVHLSEAVAEHDTVKRAEADLNAGKSPSTAAGEFVREEIEHIREGKHGARSPKQAIAIGLSKARRSGVPVRVPARGQTSERTRKAAKRDVARGPKRGRPSAKRSRATLKALKREPTATVSKRALSTQAKRAAAKRKRSGATTSKTSAARQQKRRTAARKRKRASASPRRSTRTKSSVAAR